MLPPIRHLRSVTTPNGKTNYFIPVIRHGIKRQVFPLYGYNLEANSCCHINSAGSTFLQNRQLHSKNNDRNITITDKNKQKIIFYAGQEQLQTKRTRYLNPSFYEIFRRTFSSKDQQGHNGIPPFKQNMSEFDSSSSSSPTKPESFEHSTPSSPTSSNSLPHDSEDRASSQHYRSYLASFPKSLRRLAQTIPSAAFRHPTKEELLSRTSSFFERLRIRFKWLTIRSFRKYRADDYSAFVTWLLGGVGIWVIVGTTSFVAFVFFLLNSLQMQEYIAVRLGRYLTSSSGLNVIFEMAIVPKFSLKDSRLSFHNVYVSRGPFKLDENHITEVGSQVVVQRIARALSPDANPNRRRAISSKDSEFDPSCSAFHLAIDSVDVSLSLWRWLDGKGLVKDVNVRGVRGVLDRSHIKYDPEKYKDRTAYRNVPQPGDFQLESCNIEDVLISIFQPDNFRPYTLSIFSGTIQTLRKQWLLYDMLSADLITGQVDNCLFSLHKPQSIERTGEDSYNDKSWKRMSRFRVDGVPIDHLKSPRDEGPLTWILSGRADLVADIRFPYEPTDDLDLNAILINIVDKFDEAVGMPTVLPEDSRIPGQPNLAVGKPLQAPNRVRSMFGLVEEKPGEKQDTQRQVSIDLDIRFKDVKATVPIFTNDLSYVNNALVRPIVAFINSNRTLIPVKCAVDIDIAEFDGSWTFFDTGLLDAIAEQIYEALAYHVQTSNDKRAKAVGLWSLQLTAQAILSALRGNFDLHL